MTPKPPTGAKTRRVTAMPHDEFRKLRKSTGFNQDKLAKLCGISAQSIRNYESGRTTVPKWIVFIVRVLAAKRQALITGQRPTLSTD